MLVKATRYFKTLKHPLGEGLYLKFGLEFRSEEKAMRFKEMDLDWEEGIEVIEISKEEYEENTEGELEYE